MDEQYRKPLLDIVKKAIKFGLQNNARLVIDPEAFDPVLREKSATFVTLHISGVLRGCIGSLTAISPLIEDLADNAYSAAFSDPRFPPLEESEFDKLQYHISILSETSPITFTSEKDLISQLRPNVDGLVLTEGAHKGTFLPSVWEQLPNRDRFLKHLKQKAGLSQDYWRDDITIERYEVDEFEG
jgi:AmmeMemoRadiSam system protein A